jgi:uncharacterized repeat protein (TIGR01451 family)
MCQSSCDVYYYITVDSSYVGDSLKIVDTVSASLLYAAANTTGASPWIVSVPISAMSSYFRSQVYDVSVSGGFVFFAGPITKVICGYDTVRYIDNGHVYPVTNPCEYSTVAGNVYIDNNDDCVFDSGDVELNGISVVCNEALSSTAAGWEVSGGTGYGTYNFLNSLQLSWMTSFTVAIPSYYAFIFPASSCFSTIDSFTTLPQLAVDFPLQCTSSVDVQCYALSPASVRLHRAFYMQPFVSNTGCDVASGELTLVKDSRVIYDASTSAFPADTVRGDTLIWNYTNLTNLSGGAYWNSFTADLSLSPDATVTIGDTLCFRVYTNIPAADIDPSNNDYTICLPVVYSYDPNLKEVSPKGTGTEGYIPQGTDTLTYNLHFQNTGSDVAYNVSIIDTLDPAIRPSSLKIIGTSHQMTPQWLAPNVVQFNFNNINLPDSTSSEGASEGEVRFSVLLNPGLMPGTQIKNTGYIYFDLNPAVVTNSTLNTIARTTSIAPLSTNLPVKVYPNPATDQITVEHLSGGQLSIMSLSGATVLSQNITNDMAKIDLTTLPAGVYVLKTVSNNSTTTTKFIKL